MQKKWTVILNIDADSHHFEADPDPAWHFDADPDPAFHFDADPDPTFIDTDLDPDPVYLFDADPDPAYFSMRIRSRILPFNLMRIHADPDPDPQHCFYIIRCCVIDPSQ